MTHPRCPDCTHIVKAHTPNAREGQGGCAYCKCSRTVFPPASIMRMIDASSLGTPGARRRRR